MCRLFHEMNTFPTLYCSVKRIQEKIHSAGEIMQSLVRFTFLLLHTQQLRLPSKGLLSLNSKVTIVKLQEIN